MQASLIMTLITGRLIGGGHLITGHLKRSNRNSPFELLYIVLYVSQENLGFYPMADKFVYSYHLSAAQCTCTDIL